MHSSVWGWPCQTDACLAERHLDLHSAVPCSIARHGQNINKKYFASGNWDGAGGLSCLYLKTVLHCTALYCTVLHCTVLYCTVPNNTVWYTTFLFCIESVPRREEGSTRKYQHEVEEVPEGAARWNSRDRVLVFSVLPDSSQGTDSILLIKWWRYSHSHGHSYVQSNRHVQT